jgi:hypothetical protein
MAIDNTENPEEGTPRSKKDIRKERRQMRAVNRERKSMGGEPLYSKEEIKGVKEPFKPAPGTEMTGFVNKREGYQDVKLVKEGGSPTRVQSEDKNFMVGTKEQVEKSYGPVYNQSDIVEETKPDVEYIKYEPGGPGVESKTLTTGTLKGGTKEAQDVFSATEGDEQAGLRVAKVIENKALNDDTKTFDDKKNALIVANETKEEIDNTNKQINNQVKEETENKVSVGGDGSTITKITESVEPGKIDWTLSEPAIEFSPTSRDDIYAQAKLAKRKVPQLAIEKLGVQDYYPEIGRDIAVGNFSGSYAGSRTIYSGAGGLLPLGLYDARKRAIAAEIKKKEAIMDQIKDIPDIAKQFKTEYSQEYMNFLAPWLDAYKDKPEALLSNTDFLRDMNHYKSVAENFLKVDSDLNKFQELLQPKGGDPAAWATPSMLEILRKFKAGFLPGKTTDWLTGKKNISKLTETIQALPNGYEWADKKVELLLKEGEAQIPIYPKDGVEWNSQTQEEIKKDLDGLVVSLKDESSDYETYLTSLKKYFNFDFESIANEWVNGNSLGAMTDKEKEEYKKSLAVYMLKQMPPDSIENKIERQTNDSSENWRAQLDLQNAREDRAFRAEQARLDREDSITKLEMEEMLEKGEKVRTVRTPEARIGDESPDNAIYNVYDPQQGKFRQVTGASIKRDQKSGYKYYDRTGKNLFEVPSGSFQYQQGNITYYNNNGNIKAKSTGTGYTTKYNSITGQTDLIPLNVDVSLPISEMTTAPNKIDNGRAGESDIIRGRNVSGAAKGTGGTGSYVTGYGRSSSGN